MRRKESQREGIICVDQFLFKFKKYKFGFGSKRKYTNY